MLQGLARTTGFVGKALRRLRGHSRMLHSRKETCSSRNYATEKSSVQQTKCGLCNFRDDGEQVLNVHALEHVKFVLEVNVPKYTVRRRSIQAKLPLQP